MTRDAASAAENSGASPFLRYMYVGDIYVHPCPSICPFTLSFHVSVHSSVGLSESFCLSLVRVESNLFVSLLPCLCPVLSCFEHPFMYRLHHFVTYSLHPSLLSLSTCVSPDLHSFISFSLPFPRPFPSLQASAHASIPRSLAQGRKLRKS